MTTRNTLLALTVVAATTAIPFSVSAQIFNPDNESTTVFRYQPSSTPAARVAATAPRVGEQSSSGLYVYSGSDRGWVNRVHAYAVQDGKLMHTANCLPYNLPAPLAAFVPPPQKGAFADHGA